MIEVKIGMGEMKRKNKRKQYEWCEEEVGDIEPRREEEEKQQRWKERCRIKQ